MLSFTSAGVVRTPRALQVRVGPEPGGLGVAAPAGGSLDDAEVEAAVRHFTLGQRGPRATPCDTLVLSGLPAGREPGLAAVVDAARASGIERVVLHAHRGLDPDALRADTVSLPVATPDDVAALAAWPAAERVAVVVLSPAGTAQLPGLCAALAAAPVRVVATWPLPPDGDPLAVADVPAALDVLAAALGPDGFVVKGLPACRVGRHAARVARSRNRFLVDVDHPPERARRYFPEVVAWAKVDACRSCSRDGSCDGAPRPWLESGRAGRLVPLTDGGVR